MARFIRSLGQGQKNRRLTGKASGLSQLISLGVAVPPTWVCLQHAHLEFRRRPSRTRRELRRVLAEALDPSLSYAVRSSAPDEDGTHFSRAGQYRSLLDVRTIDSILDGITEVWKAYDESAARRQSRRPLPMEVVVQQMVRPVSAGVAFSRHPITGADEVIVEAVEGTADKLLQHGRNPHRWTFRDTLTVSDWGKLPSRVLQEIVETARHIASSQRYPADLEWAYDGERLWWLQVRPITTLRGLSVYSNRISREYLPGLIKHLVWSINIPMINGAWIDLFARVVGPLEIDPSALAKRFQFRAYFNMSGMGQLLSRLGLPQDALEQMLGLVPSPRSPVGFRWKMLGHSFRLARVLVSLLTFHRRLDQWEEWALRRISDASSVLRDAEQLDKQLAWMDGYLPFMRAIAQHRIISLLLHLAVGQLGFRAAKRLGLGDVEQLELHDPRLEELDPMHGVRELARALGRLPANLRDAIDTVPFEELIHQGSMTEVRAELESFLARFGHLSQSGNDFTAIPWREDPAAVIQIARAIDTSDTGRSTPRPTRDQSRKVLFWARRVTSCRVDRERVGAVFSRGVGVLREWALAIGTTLARDGILGSPEDVFYLELEDLKGHAAGSCDGDALQAWVRQRKGAMTAAAHLNLPDIILGEQEPAGLDMVEQGSLLAGIAVSRGRYRGRSCVLRNISESNRLKDGDVLVVPFSDVAWTPLFARAGAIVAESGGILSHSSIVAREMGIPAVVSVSDACTRLADSDVIVDGLEGTVQVVER